VTEPHMLARSTDPDTSHDAAAIAALSPSSAAIKTAILRALRKHGPRTAFELRELYLTDGIGPACQDNSINRRISDLRNIGLVVDTGNRRPTPYGRKAIVWRATTFTEQKILMLRYGLEGLVDIDDVEVDWQKVSDVNRLRAEIARLQRQVALLEEESYS
jgi:hypothetical protein